MVEINSGKPVPDWLHLVGKYRTKTGQVLPFSNEKITYFLVYKPTLRRFGKDGMTNGACL
jgi:hypothetical protein